jgi:chemotaxis protein CheC
MSDTVPPDILNELINIGFGRAANALSILVRRRITLSTPHSEFMPIHRLEESFGVFADQPVSSIHQAFGGSLNGNLALLMTSNNAAALLDMIRDVDPQPRPVSSADRDDLLEIGNILLNAFYGSFGNLLGLNIAFALPQGFETNPRDLLALLTREHPGLEYALIVKVHFQIAAGQVEGYLVVLLGLASIEELLRAMQTSGYLDQES